MLTTVIGELEGVVDGLGVIVVETVVVAVEVGLQTTTQGNFVVGVLFL